MNRLRLLNPFRIRRAVADIRRVSSGGGPKLLRLTRIGEPKGIFPVSDIEFEIEALDGTVNTFATSIPIPFPAGWAYRVARKLHVPVVSAIDHDKLRGQVAVPRRDRSKDQTGA